MHAIIAFGQHTQSNDVGRGMPSSPLGGTQDRTMSGVACHHRPWTENMVEQRRAWRAIIAFGQHRRSDGVKRCMLSSPLASTHSQTTSGMACHHRLGTAHTVGRCWALHAIIAFGQHIVKRRRAWHAIISFGGHTGSNDVRRCMPSSPLENTHGRQRRAWLDDITALGLHTRSATSGVS